MELNTPNALAGLRGRLDALYGRVVAVDEEGLPSVGEGIREFEGVLMVLTIRAGTSIIERFGLWGQKQDSYLVT